MDPVNDEEADLLPEDKVSREIGVFIKHEDFIDHDNSLDGLEARPLEKKGDKGSKDKDVPEELTKIQMVYAQDHDFYCCCHRKEDTDFETFFLKGLEIYI